MINKNMQNSTESLASETLTDDESTSLVNKLALQKQAYAPTAIMKFSGS